MTKFLLIRHAAHSLGGEKLAGRTPGVHLSEEGHLQAIRLADRLAELPIRAIYCSPVDRTRETAEHLRTRLGLPVQISEALSEVDFGEWTGRLLEELRPQQRWQQWNTFRSGTRIPEGEHILEIQSRVVMEMQRLRAVHRDECVALVSHGEPIKAAVAYFLAVPLDLAMRIEISLASVSVIAIADWGPWVLCVNSTGEVVLG